MKLFFLFVFFGVFISLSSFGDDAAFQEIKTKALQNIDERLGKLNEHRNCVNQSNSSEALQACRESMRAWLDQEKSERLEKRKERISKKQKKLKKKTE